LAKIHILSESVANKIAAGEVIERPASVVKELVENAIDAGGQKIVVSLTGGGLGGLCVSDDGEGLSAADVQLAFVRHATSKVATDADLSCIATLGFRGEALPSIAAVSRVRLVTQTAGDADGTELFLEAGEIQKVGPIGAPSGSLFEVSDLFFNTPARKKFLKSPQTEIGHIHDIVLQAALISPEIHFRLLSEGKVTLDAPPVSTLKARAEALLGQERVASCVEVCGESAGISVAALLSRPPLSKNDRRNQYLFVNGRPIKNATLTHAIYDAYGSFLMKGEHPFFVLALSLDPAVVDVNVHPAKREVRFQNADRVHQAVVGLLRSALASSDAPWETTGQAVAPPAPRPKISPSAFSSRPATRAAGGWPGWPEAGGARDPSQIQTAEGQATAPAASVVPLPLEMGPTIRPLGQVYATFLLAEIDGEMTLVDQHAAHERLLYEQMLKEKAQSNRRIQPFLIPPQIDLSPRQAGVMAEHLDLVAGLGWKIEPFGARTFLVREAPACLATTDVPALFADLVEEMETFSSVTTLEDRERALRVSMACHAAVRAGQVLSLDEIQALLTDYFQRQTPPTCPHGRPVLIRYTRDALDKLFRRQ